jgi:cell division protein FtsI/penicillin-binding protein 2
MIMTMRPAAALVVALLLAACTTSPTPEPTPAATTFPVQPADAATAVARRFVDAWAAGDYEAMHATLDPVTRERYPAERFAELHADFSELAGVTGIEASLGEPAVVGLAPQPRPPDFPAPTPTPVPEPSRSAAATATPQPTAAPDESERPLAGPVPGMAVPVSLSVASERFDALALERAITLVQGRNGWLVRWTPETLFAELGDDGELRLDRELGTRGRIVGGDGTVWAETRDDGARVYPQEALAGQTIGYVSEVTAEDLATLEAEGYRAGDVVGRSGLEAGAEDLLRGRAGWSLVAVAADGTESVVAEREVVPGADVTVTLRPDIQQAAQSAVAGYAQASTAVVDPTDGDVWALVSQPAFNPNAMTIGTTLDGTALAAPGDGAIMNKATLGRYPAGSSFKPFALAAALQTGVVTPASTRACPPTWQYGTFTFRNYMDHSLPGAVGFAESMAFSCNTTYMPLALEVYEASATALTDLLKDFGFGQPTGIGFVSEEAGIVPDDAWLAENGRGGYSGFEQIQLSIGQGAFLGTPLQLANAYAAIGNGGRLWTPRIVTRAVLPDGTVAREVEPSAANDVPVDDGDLAFVTDTMEAVVTLPYGTGTAAFVGFGIPVAGKSGTAETGTPDPHAWFPAFAPADDPTISVATVLPYFPLGTGGDFAAPLVRIVMAAHFAQ